MTDLPSRDVLTFGPPFSEPAPRGLTFTSSWWSRDPDEPSRPASVTIKWYPTEADVDPGSEEIPDWVFEVVDQTTTDPYEDGGVQLMMSTHANAYRAFARIPKFFAALADAENHWPSDCTSLDNVVRLLCRLGARPRRAPWDTPEISVPLSD